MSKLTSGRLREVLSYDADLGFFTWRVKSSRRVKIGDIAGCHGSSGYYQIRIDRRTYLAHRLAWLYVHGCWPSSQIDHINGNKADNRLVNLREATIGENMQNFRSARSDNKSCGLLGASFHKPTGRWRAQIQVNGRVLHLGRFDTAEEAHVAYLAAKRELHPFQTIAI